MDHAKANPIQPAGSAQQILFDSFVSEEVHHRLERDVQNLERHDMAKSVDSARGCREGPWVTTFDIETQVFAILTFENTRARPCIDLRNKIELSRRQFLTSLAARRPPRAKHSYGCVEIRDEASNPVASRR